MQSKLDSEYFYVTKYNPPQKKNLNKLSKLNNEYITSQMLTLYNNCTQIES